MTGIYVYVPSKMTKDFGVASRRILQLEVFGQTDSCDLRLNPSYHSSSSTLNVLAFENMLSYAPILVKIESTGHNLSADILFSS